MCGLLVSKLLIQWMVAIDKREAGAITEPSAAAPDAGVYVR
jgi:hypothetical protein